MASQAQVLQEFLYSLGFKIDETGAKKFRSGLSETTKDAMKLGGAVIGIGVAIEQFVQHMAEGMEKLYFLSQRTGESVSNLRAFGSAAENVGVQAEQAQQLLKQLYMQITYNPGTEAWLQGVGSQFGGKDIDITKGPKEQMDQMLDLWEKVQKEAKATGDNSSLMNLANQTQRMLGVSIDAMDALARQREEMRKTELERASAMGEAGINQEDYAAKSHQFMDSLRGLGFEFGLLADQLNNKLLGPLTSFVASLTELTAGIVRANGAATEGESTWARLWRLITTGESTGGAPETAAATIGGQSSDDSVLRAALEKQRAARGTPAAGGGTVDTARRTHLVDEIAGLQMRLDSTVPTNYNQNDLITWSKQLNADKAELGKMGSVGAGMSAVTPGTGPTMRQLSGNRPAEVGQPAPVQTEVNISPTFHITGDNAEAIGAAVSSRQRDVNAEALRNLKSNNVPNAAPVPNSTPTAP